MIKGGFHQKLLRIDLTEQTYSVEHLDEDLLRKYYGGRTLGGKLLWDEVPVDADPLGPENKLIFCSGAFGGTPVPSANRYCLVTKSPTTNLYCDSYSGGHYGPQIKFAGYDVIILQGVSEKPVTVFVEDDKVSFLDASHLWGKNAWDTEETLEKELGEGAHIVTIGIGGENLCNFAVVQNEYYHEAGRGGVGAVFGSKKLKALAIRGNGGVKVADPEGLVNYLRESIEPHFTSTSGGLGAAADRMKYGTPMTLNITNKVGILPTKNFRYGQYEFFDHIDGNAFRNEVAESDKGCFGCNFSCVKFSRVKSGPYEGSVIGGPEYETDALLGANVGVPDMNFIVHINGVCDDYGLDTIGTGVAIGFAMELYETGVLTKEDFGGLEMNFGNQEAAIELAKMIGRREGIGDVLARGVKQASEIIGHGSEKMAMHVKGLEFPAYRPGINSPGFGLAYCIADRGACHRRAWPSIAEQKYPPFSTEGRAQLVKNLYDERIPWHDGVCCDIGVLTPGFTFEDAAAMYSYVTGWDVDVEEMNELCERTATLLRALNTRYGMKREDDTLPARSFEPEVTEKGKGLVYTKEMLDTMLEEYYGLRNWNTETGVPYYQTMVDLGLEDEANEMRERGLCD